MQHNSIFRIAIAFLLSIPMLGLQAQIENYRFGLNISPTISYMTSNDKRINANGANLGITIASIAERHLNENYIITGGIQMTFNRGGQLLHDIGGNLLFDSNLESPYDSLPDGTNIRYHIQYLEIPIGFKMRTREFGYWRFFAHAPILQLGINMGSSGDIEGPGIPTSEGDNIRSDVNLFNLAYGLGIGAEYSLTASSSILAGIYYMNGFSDITDDSARKRTGDREDSKGALGNVSIMIGILF